MSACYLNALGMLTCLGTDAATTMAGLQSGSRDGFFTRRDLRADPAVVAAIETPLQEADALPSAFKSRNNQILSAVLAQIDEAINKAILKYGAARVGVVIGSSTSGILEGGRAIQQKLATEHFPAEYEYAQQEIGNPSEFIRWKYSLRGPAYTVSTACTSGAKAMSAAARLLDSGICDAVVTGGVDSLCPLTVQGFSALESVSVNGCNPFSLNRDGITIGEGAAVFLATREESPVFLAGWGESSDAHHMSAPDPSGAGAEIAINEALKQAGIGADKIAYVNLHGTGTHKNDLMESHVTHRVYGSDTPVSSTKGMLGHTLGAAGAIEAGICWFLLMEENPLLPVHAWDAITDPELCELNFCRKEMRLARGPGRYLASHSFAFGGSNAVLILGDSA